jgi:RNA polymerase nonessential primary-like sigma factor
MNVERQRGDEHDLVQQYFSEIKKKPRLSREQELELGELKDAGSHAWKQLHNGSFVTRERGIALADTMHAGDKARDQIVEGHLLLVAKIAHKYIGHGLSYLDLIQAGNEALIKSVDKYDYKKGYRVVTYAGKMITWGIRAALAEQSRLIRYPQLQRKKLRAFEKIKHTPDATKLSDAEIATKMDLSEHMVEDLTALSHYTRVPLSDTMPSPSPSHEEVIYSHKRAKTIQERVSEAVNALPEQQKVIVVRRYGLDGASEEIISLRQLGEEQGTSYEGIRLREKRAFRTLQETLKDLR